MIDDTVAALAEQIAVAARDAGMEVVYSGIRLTPEQIEQALNATGAEEGKTYWIHTKDPDVQAAADLLNRAIGKAVEEQNVTLTVNEPLAQRLKRTKERLGL